MSSLLAFEVRENVLTATITGKIDGRTAPELQSQLMNALGSAASAILDVENVAYMSSAGFRMLLLLHREIMARQGLTAMVGLAEEVRDTMEMTGFLDFFLLHETIEEALAEVRNHATANATTR